MKATALAIITGKVLDKTPYTSHKKIPSVRMVNIGSDKSRVCLVRWIFNICGKNEMVVHAPAVNPITVI